MHFLDAERATLEQFLPGLDDKLAQVPLAELERPGNPALSVFKSVGGPSLLVPVAQGGCGADALQAVRVQRAIGARSPSLAVATTMHHFSVASLSEADLGDGFEWMLLEGIATRQLLVASGFAEGGTADTVLRPALRAVRRGGDLIVTGSKKPCSLSRSMDLMTASVTVADEDGLDRMAVVVIPADSPGVDVRPFWNSWVLGGAESDEVVLTDVVVPQRLVVMSEKVADGRPDRLQTSGFVWFELLAAASYLGAVSALVERVLRPGRGSAADRAGLIVEVEAAMAMLEGVAYAKASGEPAQELLARVLCTRYAVQDAIARVSNRALELLGGKDFIESGDSAYLAAASAGLMFHPPSRSRMSDALCDHFAGRPLRIG